MKALVKKFPQRGLWFEDVPEPQVGRNDVKIKIHKTAICGTDLHIYNWDEWSQRTIQIFAKADRIVISVAKMHIRPFFKTTFRVKTHGAFCFRAGITSNKGTVH